MVSMDEGISVCHAKIKYAHPDGTQDPEERRVREDRTKRLNLAIKRSRRPNIGGERRIPLKLLTEKTRAEADRRRGARMSNQL